MGISIGESKGDGGGALGRMKVAFGPLKAGRTEGVTGGMGGVKGNILDSSRVIRNIPDPWWAVSDRTKTGWGVPGRMGASVVRVDGIEGVVSRIDDVFERTEASEGVSV
jgi:hypothetical protein